MSDRPLQLHSYDSYLPEYSPRHLPSRTIVTQQSTHITSQVDFTTRPNVNMCSSSTATNRNSQTVESFQGLNFHLGTVSFAIIGTLLILMILLCCFHGYRRATAPSRGHPPPLPLQAPQHVYAQPHRDR